MKKTMIIKKTDTIKFYQKFVEEELLPNMSESKRASLRAAMNRNFILTSEDNLCDVSLTVYKEGYYLEARGCRCRWSMWISDNDGEFICERKPVEKKLNPICVCYFFQNYIDFRKVA